MPVEKPCDLGWLSTGHWGRQFTGVWGRFPYSSLIILRAFGGVIL